MTGAAGLAALFSVPSSALAVASYRPLMKVASGSMLPTNTIGQLIILVPQGVSYYAIEIEDHGFLDDTAVFEVPPGHYFMLGDNRDNSLDSRLPDDFGEVPADHVIGHVTH